ncbi:alpha/beta hydrolase [Siphonobacter curvatus]|uniref:Alpha/beta hydrolase n=1 Tax=Siphonobacter curvatus TaxID=2094562 RepID=A0A2S7IGZ8_9BACT|nr:hypothetical protein [Siphonobacter curvatus]PQA55072.1 hypothetical protein C5O19_21245 [Siphonobacter curvatus]
MKSYRFFSTLLGWAVLLFLSFSTSAQSTAATDLLLPAPSGKHGVGRYWLCVRDSSRGNREISVFAYVPTEKTNQRQFVIPTQAWRSAYLPVLQKKLGESAANAVATSKAYLTEHPSLSGRKKWPVILFAPGLGWSTLEYSFIIQELVSAGNVVVAVNSSPVSPVVQSPVGSFVTESVSGDKYQVVADDLSYVLNQLHTKAAEFQPILAHVDFQRMAVLGHSLGGAAALLTASTHENLKAAINLDGDLMEASAQAKPHCPVLFLNQIPAPMEKRSWQALKQDSDRGWRYEQMAKTTAQASQGLYISIASIYHSNFQDYALLAPDLIPETIRKVRLGPIDGRTGLQRITFLLRTYLDQVLKGTKVDWQSISRQYPEVRIIDTKS